MQGTALIDTILELWLPIKEDGAPERVLIATCRLDGYWVSCCF